jgi:purine nucleosidase
MRLPLIVDCDPGIDDALALLLAAASPEFELLAVTAVAGNRPVETTSRNACRILELAGRAEVPVHAGASRMLAHPQARSNLVHGEDGLGGVPLPASRGPQVPAAYDALIQQLTTAPKDSVAIAALGPLTNLALAELRNPGVLRRAKVLAIMGGAAFCGGNITPDAEFNFYADPVAAHVVLTSGARIALFPLDVTSQVHMTADWIASFTRERRAAAAARAMLEAYSFVDPLLHDACPIAWLVDPTLFDGSECSVAVSWGPGPHEGQTTVWDATRNDRPFAPNATVFTRTQPERLLSLVRRRIESLA